MVVLPRSRINTTVHLARCPRTVGNGRNNIKVVAVERGQGGKVISVADPFRKRLTAASHQVLSVAGLAEGDVKPSPEETARLFSENIVSQVVTLKSGEVDSEASKVAETFDQQKLAKDPATSEAAPKN